MDPLADSPWSTPDTVAGFVRSPPNETLLAAAGRELGAERRRLLDIGCGAGRNAVPLARQGWRVVGTDLSWPMLCAAAARGPEIGDGGGQLGVALAPMEQLPIASRSMDFVVAHGIWNLAGSGATFRRAVAEAGRVARRGAALFVFTFSRHTLAPEARPVPGEDFVYTEFSGRPQCFLTEAQLRRELEAAGFALEGEVREYNRPGPGVVVRSAGPVIYEAVFRRG